jgi:hypothetical protein
MSNISIAHCQPLHVACSFVGQYVWLISVHFERKAAEIHPPNLNRRSPPAALHKHSQGGEVMYGTYKSTFLLLVWDEMPFNNAPNNACDPILVRRQYTYSLLHLGINFTRFS